MLVRSKEPCQRKEARKRNTCLLLLSTLTLPLIVSCTQGSGTDTNRRGDSNTPNAVVESLIIAKDENGSPLAIKGYTENTALKNDDIFDTRDFTSEDDTTQKVFEFEPPAAYDSEFSEPVLVTASYLTSPSEVEQCSAKTYKSSEPTLEDVFSFGRQESLCGSVSLNFCIRLSSKENKEASAYLKSPPLKIYLLCASDSFSDTSIKINDGASQASAASVDLQFSGIALLAQMYVTNSKGCTTGGSWQAIAAEKKAWSLAQTTGEATVYGKFRDIAGHESSCLSATITAASAAPVVDLEPPTAASLAINGGNSFTGSSAVTLSLAATGASAMYVSNVSGCASGGTWKAYGPSSPWTLAQTNAVATVYAKFRDAALNETNCIPDTIVHDSADPSDPAAFSDGVTTFDRAKSPTLSWTASTDAGSGLGGYHVAIGTTPGGSNLKAWTDVGSVVSTVVSGLALSEGIPYYGSVRAFDAVGNQSAEINGDGFVYVTPWKQQAFIKASNGDANDYFGGSVSLFFDTLAVGSTGDDSNETTITNATHGSVDNSMATSGAVYVYKRTASSWVQEAYIKSYNNKDQYNFGFRVSLSEDLLAVGTPDESSNATAITNGTTASVDTSSIASGAVYVYKRAAASWEQEAYIKPYNNDFLDFFGGNISLDSDTLAVAATGEDSDQASITNGTTPDVSNINTDSGAVYVFRRTANTWAQEAYIKAANNDDGDLFGATLSLSSDTLAIGARYEASNQITITNGTTASLDNSYADSGAVYIYKRTGTSWEQEAYIKSSNNDIDDNFYSSISLSLDSLAVGAIKEDSNATTITNGSIASADNSSLESGAVYLYKRTASSWAQEAYIKASNGDTNDWFGSAVSLSSDTLAVGAYAEASNVTLITNGTSASADNSNLASGAVYVYKRTATSWAQEAYIKAVNNAAGANFGISVSLATGTLATDTLAVGAYGESSNETTITNGTSASSDNTKTDSGAVYIYTRQ